MGRKKTKRQRRSFSREFKLEAVKLVKETDRSVKQVARELGISASSLSRWVKQYEVDAGEADGFATEDKEELRRLRRENRELRMERDILEKATAFFARESK